MYIYIFVGYRYIANLFTMAYTYDDPRFPPFQRFKPKHLFDYQINKQQNRRTLKPTVIYPHHMFRHVEGCLYVVFI